MTRGPVIIDGRAWYKATLRALAAIDGALAGLDTAATLERDELIAAPGMRCRRDVKGRRRCRFEGRARSVYSPREPNRGPRGRSPTIPPGGGGNPGPTVPVQSFTSFPIPPGGGGE